MSTEHMETNAKIPTPPAPPVAPPPPLSLPADKLREQQTATTVEVTENDVVVEGQSLTDPQQPETAVNDGKGDEGRAADGKQGEEEKETPTAVIADPVPTTTTATTEPPEQQQHHSSNSAKEGEEAEEKEKEKDEGNEDQSTPSSPQSPSALNAAAATANKPAALNAAAVSTGAAGASNTNNTTPQNINKNLLESTNLLVAGLTRDVDDARLATMFQPYGEVTSTVVMLKSGTGVSRGFGFVRYTKPESARAACAALHGTRCGPNTLNVRLSVHTGEVVESSSIFVRNLPPEVDEEGIRTVFDRFGPIDAVVLRAANAGPPGGAGEEGKSPPHGDSGGGTPPGEPSSPTSPFKAGGAVTGTPHQRLTVATITYFQVDHARAAMSALHHTPFIVPNNKSTTDQTNTASVSAEQPPAAAAGDTHTIDGGENPTETPSTTNQTPTSYTQTTEAGTAVNTIPMLIKFAENVVSRRARQVAARRQCETFMAPGSGQQGGGSTAQQQQQQRLASQHPPSSTYHAKIEGPPNKAYHHHHHPSAAPMANPSGKQTATVIPVSPFSPNGHVAAAAAPLPQYLHQHPQSPFPHTVGPPGATVTLQPIVTHGGHPHHHQHHHQLVNPAAAGTTMTTLVPIQTPPQFMTAGAAADIHRHQHHHQHHQPSALSPFPPPQQNATVTAVHYIPTTVGSSPPYSQSTPSIDVSSRNLSLAAAADLPPGFSQHHHHQQQQYSMAPVYVTPIAPSGSGSGGHTAVPLHQHQHQHQPPQHQQGGRSPPAYSHMVPGGPQP